MINETQGVGNEPGRSERGELLKTKFKEILEQLFIAKGDVQPEAHGPEKKLSPDEIVLKLRKTLTEAIIVFSALQFKSPEKSIEKTKATVDVNKKLEAYRILFSLVEYCATMHDVDDIHGDDLDEELGPLFDIQLATVESILRQIDSVLQSETIKNSDRLLLYATSLWFKMFDGSFRTVGQDEASSRVMTTGQYDSFLLVEKQPWWPAIKTFLGEETSNPEAREFLAQWDEQRDVALDKELRFQLGGDDILMRAAATILGKVLHFGDYKVASKTERGERKLEVVFEKLVAISKEHPENPELLFILTQDQPETTKLKQWQAKAKELKIKLPLEAKKALQRLKEIETFTVHTEKIKRIQKKLGILYLLSLAMPGVAEFTSHLEQYAWQAVSLIPPDMRTDAFAFLVSVYGDRTAVNDSVQLASFEGDVIEPEETEDQPEHFNSLYPTDTLTELEALYQVQNEEYQTIDQLYGEAVAYYETHGGQRQNIFWQPSADFVTPQDLVDSGFRISNAAEAGDSTVYSQDLLDLYQLSGDPFSGIHDITHFLSIIHGEEFTDETTRWYIQDYYNFTLSEYVRTGERVPIGDLLGFALVRNNGKLNLALWDVAIFTKILTRNDGFTFTFNASQSMSGFPTAELLTEPFSMGYTTEDLIEVLGNDPQFWNVTTGEGGNKDFDPANMIGVDYHILFTLAWADRMPISALSMGVINEMRMFAAEGEYGDHKVWTQLNFFASNLGTYAAILDTASNGIPAEQLHREVQVNHLSYFLETLPTQEDVVRIEQQLRGGEILTFTYQGETSYIALQGSDLQPYVVVSSSPDDLRRPLSVNELLAATEFENHATEFFITETNSEPLTTFVDIEDLPEDLAFYFLQGLPSARDDGMVLSSEHREFIEQHPQEFVDYVVTNIEVTDLNSHLTYFLVTELSEYLPESFIFELSTYNYEVVLDNFSLFEDRIDPVELVVVVSHSTEVNVVPTIVANYPEIFVPHFQELLTADFAADAFDFSLKEDILVFETNTILENYESWESVFSREDLYTYYSSTEDYLTLAYYPEIFAPLIDDSTYDELLRLQVDGLIVKFYEGWNQRYEGDQVLGFYNDLYEINPDEADWYVAMNMEFFSSLLIEQTEEGAVASERAVDLLTEIPFTFVSMLSMLPEDHELRTVFNAEWLLDQGESINGFTAVIAKEPSIFATALSEEEVTEVLLDAPDFFLDYYFDGWNEVVTLEEVKTILIENNQGVWVLGTPVLFSEITTQEELSALILTDEDMETFLSSYGGSRGRWSSVVSQESILDFVENELTTLQNGAEGTPRSLGYYVLSYPEAFGVALTNSELVIASVQAEPEIFIEGLEMRYLVPYITDEVADELMIWIVDDDVRAAVQHYIIDYRASAEGGGGIEDDDLPFSLD